MQQHGIFEENRSHASLYMPYAMCDVALVVVSAIPSRSFVSSYGSHMWLVGLYHSYVRNRSKQNVIEAMLRV